MPRSAIQCAKNETINIYVMKNTRINRFILILVAASFLGLAATGCKHTANGAGKDIEQMGEKIQDKTQ